mgnify:CR=1 FL=1
MNVESMHSETFHRYELDHGLAHHKRLLVSLRSAIRTRSGALERHKRDVAEGRRNGWEFVSYGIHLRHTIKSLESKAWRNLERSNPFLTRTEYISRVQDIATLIH